MSPKKLTRLEWWLFLTPLLMVAVYWLLSTSRQNWPESWRLGYARDKSWQSGCQNNLKYLHRSLAQYAADYDGRFPPVQGQTGALGTGFTAISPQGGWADLLGVYLKSSSAFPCPANRKHTVSDIDYWFNANLSTLPKSKLASPASTFLVGEGNDGKDVSDATYNKTSLPPNWLTDRNSPAFRHLGGANYLMADGSVHWLKPPEVTTFGGRKDAFAVK